MNLLSEYVCGMTWGWVGNRGTWMTSEAVESMGKLKSLHVNWAIISFCVFQERPQSVEIKFRDAPTVTDEEIRFAVSQAKELGMKVCLKPVVNCSDGTWRAHINFFDKEVPGEPSWGQWFESYNRFIQHYAALAEETDCDLFCIGCEMVQSDRREQEWRNLIHRVRCVYSGPITYNCDKYQEDRLTWWDAVDVISSSGYYPISDWETQLDRIERVTEQIGKPFIFIEAGCPSRKGAGQMPNNWNHSGAADEEEQDEYYQVMFEACSRRPWLRGFGLWDWPVKLYDLDSAKQNDDYCMYGKKAEKRIGEFYAARRMLKSGEGL